MAKKRAPHESLRLPTRSEPQVSLPATDDHSSRDPARQPLRREDKRRLREQTRSLFEEDWAAPAGSPEEKQLLRAWKRHGNLSEEDRQLIDKWLIDPDRLKTERGILFMRAAKQRLFGEVVLKTATERQEQLDDKEWLVAYFTAHGVGQREIARRAHLSDRSIDDVISSLKDRIIRDYNCDIEAVKLPQITRWFLGL